MRNKIRPALCLAMFASLIIPALARADSVLEFQVRENRLAPATTQSISVKDGRMMAKAAGGNKDIDLLYSRAEERVVIVDHRKRSLMTINAQEIERINQQAQDLQPLLQGVSEQIAKLSPAERQKWQELLGDAVSLDRMAKASELAAPTRMVSLGARQVAGFSCRAMQVMQGKTPLAEVCLAEPAALKISDSDNATIRALFDFYLKLAVRSQKIAGQMGLSLPILASREVKGIPIKMLDLSSQENMTVTLKRVATVAVSPDLMRIPGGYKAEPLSLLQ